MTKKEFNIRWEHDDLGDGITWQDIADCYVKWNLGSTPETKPMLLLRYLVLKAANTTDAEDYKPKEE
jgi:hypothetical protein